MMSLLLLHGPLPVQEHDAAVPDSAGGEPSAVLATVATEAAVQATLEAVHPALGILGEVVIELHRSRLLPRWMRVVDDQLREQNVQLDPADPRIEALFIRFSRAAVQTARREKWQFLAAALVSSTTSEFSGDFVVDYFADLVTRYTPEHVRVLQVVAAPASHGLNLDTIDADNLLVALASPADQQEHDDLQLAVETVWGQLVADGLIGAGFIAGFNRVLGTEGEYEEQPPPDEGDDRGLTSAGRRFLRYVQADESSSADVADET